MNTQTRKSPIYGNCQVYSPDNELMFRCEEKRVKWYLDRNLATIIQTNPLCIKLTFTPKGKGETVEALKMERFNRCVVCGSEDMGKLTKHHMVPFVYRQHFPEKRKEHSSFFVVPICKDCHLEYENKYATVLKSVLAEAYSAPINGVFSNDKMKTLSIIRCLLRFDNQIPQDRKEFLKNKLQQNLIDFGMEEYSKMDLYNKETLEKIDFILTKESKKQVAQSHGKMVVERVLNLDAFERMWGKHFMENMKPKYIPEYITKSLADPSS